ncbi:hypothetical protein CN640_13355 [Bacillus pseudomycoides]|nr:hypothetical protein CN640_13355 [Bacillus pseudomycoides]
MRCLKQSREVYKNVAILLSKDNFCLRGFLLLTIGIVLLNKRNFAISDYKVITYVIIRLGKDNKVITFEGDVKYEQIHY